MKFQGTFELPATSPEGVASIEVVIIPLDVSQPIEVTDFSIHVCGEVSTTTSLPAGTTPSELTGSTTAGAAGSPTAGAAGSTTAGAAGSTKAGAAGSTTAGAAGSIPTSVCSIENLLDKDDTVLTTDPEARGARPGKGPFKIWPTDETPTPKITVTAASPTTVMGVTVTGTNIKNVTVIFKDVEGNVLDTVTLTENPSVSQIHFIFHRKVRFRSRLH